MLKSRGEREENEKLLLSVKETCGLTGLSERKTGGLNIFLERVNILMYL